MNAAAHARLDLDYTNNREMTCIALENFVAVKVSTNKFSCFFLHCLVNKHTSEAHTHDLHRRYGWIYNH